MRDRYRNFLFFLNPCGALDREKLKWNTTRWQNLEHISEAAYLEIGKIIIMTRRSQRRGSMSELGSPHCQFIEDPPKIRITKREYDVNSSAIEEDCSGKRKDLSRNLKLKRKLS